MTTANCLPNGAGDATALGKVGASSNWDCVNDPVGSPDDLTTMVQAGFYTSAQDDYKLDTSGVPSTAVISQIDVHSRAELQSSVTATITNKLRLSSTEVSGSAHNLTTSWAYYVDTITRPGGGSWSYADLASLQVCIALNNAANATNAYCTQVWVVVTYTTPVTVTPGVLALTLAAYAPTITIAGPVTFTPGVLALTLTAYAPTAINSSRQGYGLWDFAAAGTPNSYANCGGANQIFNWADIETSEGVYSWTALESALSAAATAGRNVIIRIYTNSDGVGQSCPTWFFTAAGSEYYTANGGYKQPVPDGTVFKSKFGAFLTAFGAAYDGDSRIEFIQTNVGGGGYGEMYMEGYAPSSWSGSVATHQIAASEYWVDTWRTAFPFTPLAIMCNDLGSSICEDIMAYADGASGPWIFQVNSPGIGSTMKSNLAAYAGTHRISQEIENNGGYSDKLSSPSTDPINGDGTGNFSTMWALVVGGGYALDYAILFNGSFADASTNTYLGSTSIPELRQNFGAGDVSVTPGVLALTLTTYTPTIAVPQAVVPGVLALTLTAYAPTVAAPRAATPDALALTLTTYAPSVAVPRLVTPDALALTLTGYAPVVATPVTITPDLLALTLTTYAPAVTETNGLTVIPDALALIISTFAPSVDLTANEVVTPSARALSLTCYAPVVAATANVAVVPSIGALALTTYAPAVAAPRAVSPDVLSLALTGYAPSALAPRQAVPDAGSLVITIYAPSVVATDNISISPAVLALTLAMYAATMSIHRLQFVPLAASAVTLQAMDASSVVMTGLKGSAISEIDLVGGEE